MRNAWIAWLVGFCILTSFNVYGANSPQTACTDLLVRHLDDGSMRAESWDKLPSQLEQIDGATILVSAGQSPLQDFFALTAPIDGLQSPDSLKVFYGDGLAFVSKGSSTSLMKLYERGKASPLTLSYQILDFSVLQNAAFFPVLFIPIDSSFDKQALAKAENYIDSRINAGESFAVYDIGHAQMVFFTPRNILNPEISAGVLQNLKIKTTWPRKRPLNWSDWILRKSEAFAQKSAFVSGDWAVLSPSAYAMVYDLARLANSKLPSLESVDRELRSALRDCLSPACEVPPPQNPTVAKAEVQGASGSARDTDGLTMAARRRIMDFLKRHGPRGGVTQAQGIQKAFLSLGTMIDGKPAQKEYKTLIRSLAFTKSEYQLILKPERSEIAQERFTQSWRAFLSAVKSPYAAQSLSYSNVVRAIRAIDKD